MALKDSSNPETISYAAEQRAIQLTGNSRADWVRLEAYMISR